MRSELQGDLIWKIQHENQRANHLGSGSSSITSYKCQEGTPLDMLGDGKRRAHAPHKLHVTGITRQSLLSIPLLTELTKSLQDWSWGHGGQGGGLHKSLSLSAQPHTMRRHPPGVTCTPRLFLQRKIPLVSFGQPPTCPLRIWQVTYLSSPCNFSQFHLIPYHLVLIPVLHFWHCYLYLCGYISPTRW